MAVLRALLVLLLIAAFYIFGTPIQWLARTRSARVAALLPRLFHRSLTAILRVRVMREGGFWEAAPLLLVANHVSWVDIVALSACGAGSFLAKSEVRAWPILGTFARLQNSIFVDRQRFAGLPKVNAEIAERLGAGDRIVLFAEATTTDGSGLLRFRAAHFAAAEALLAANPLVARVALQPVAISYVSHDGHTGVAWYGDMDLLPHVWAMLKGGPFDCLIRIGQPIFFERGSDRKSAARATEDAVRALLGNRRASDGVSGNEDSRAAILSGAKTP